MLEIALPYSEKSSVIATWLIPMLSPYFHNLPSYAVETYKIKSNMLFIALLTSPDNEDLVMRSMQSLQVYCSNGKNRNNNHHSHRHSTRSYYHSGFIRCDCSCTRNCNENGFQGNYRYRQFAASCSSRQ